MAESPRLGPFILTDPLGKGGMGEVWAARHARQGTRVAIKVLHTADPGLIEAIHNEVRAVAALCHPHIIWIHDYGVVPDGVARLFPGTPWFAMELAEGPPLRKAVRKFGWPEVRALGLELLDALAHAHARGVIHRDIKPANLLLGADSAGLKLTDFGMVLARQHVEEGGVPLTGGSPRYMAPEQFLMTWSEQGPWTDLYAVGCLMWALCCGRPPFPSKNYRELYDAHWNDSPPQLKPRFSVPEGLEAWIHQLMAKQPQDRPAFAADAALALARLPPAPPVPGAPADIDHDAPTLVRGAGTALHLPRASGRRLRAPAPGGSACPPPPIPDSWRPPAEHRPPLTLQGAGLALYGLRAIPPVGRAIERDALWAELRAVHRELRPRVVLLRGPAGCGKTHLAGWLGRRAQEVGAALTLKATHSPTHGSIDGLAGMLARDARAPGLPREELDILLERAEPEPDAREILRRILSPYVVDGQPEPVTAPQRWDATTGWLRRRSERRPLILWLDDLQWGADALRYVHTRLMEEPLPLLVVATIREEALQDQPEMPEYVAELEALERCSSLVLRALPRAASRQLIDSLLGLDDDLLDELTDRTAGNPLFAIQLVGDWVERGILELGPDGFRPAKGASLTLPASLREVWTQRLQHVLAGQRWSLALELAAVLGQDVDAEEWREACHVAGTEFPEGLVAALLEDRLARVDAAGQTWSFVHGMLRETILEAAGERTPDLHRAAAAMLANRERAHARRGRHLVAAGDVVDALHPLLDGAFDRFEEGDLAGMERLLTERDSAMSDAGIPPSDERWGGTWNYRARHRYSLGRTDEAFRWWNRTLAAGRRHSWRQERMVALYDTSLVLSTRGKHGAALERSREAVEVAQTLDKPLHLANARYHLCSAALSAGSVHEAVAAIRPALETFRSVDNRPRVFDALLELGRAHDMLGEIERGRGFFQEALTLAVELDIPVLKLRAWFMRGDHLRFVGDWEGAEESLRRAVEIGNVIGGTRWPYLARLQLALVLLRNGRDDAARAQLAECAGAQLAGHRIAIQLCELILGATGPAFESLLQSVSDSLAGAKVDAGTALALQTAALRATPARAARIHELYEKTRTKSGYRWPTT